MKRSNSGSSLVGTLVAMAVVLFAIVVYVNDPFGWMGGSNRKDGKGETIVGESLLAAKDVTCRTQLKQLRTKITMMYDEQGSYPSGLQETSMQGNFFNCPVGNVDYNYDSDNGLVTCPHIGHEKY